MSSSRTSNCAATTRSSCRRPRRRVAAAGLVAVLAVPEALAADWTLAPTLLWVADHASNRDLTDLAVPGQSLTIESGLRLRRATPVAELNLTSQLRMQRYSGSSYADSEDYVIDLGYRIASKRRDVELGAYQRAQSTLLSDLDSGDLIQADARRRDRGLSGALTAAITERMQGNVRVSISDIRYDGRDARLFSDYRYPTIAGGLRYAVNERTAMVANASWAAFEVLSRALDTRDIGASVGVLRRLSERYEWQLMAGYGQTESRGRTETGWNGRMMLERKFRRSSWQLSFERAVQPSGLGSLLRRSISSAQYGIDISPRLRAAAGVRVTRNDSVLDATVGERRRVDDAELRLDWRIGRSWWGGWKTAYSRAGGGADALVTTEEAFSGWRVALSLSWVPGPRSMGW